MAQIVNSASEQHLEACLDIPVILIREVQFQRYQPYVKCLAWTNVTVHETQQFLPFVLPALDFTITRIQLPFRKGIESEVSVTRPPWRRKTLPKRLPRFIPATAILAHLLARKNIRTVQAEKSCWCLLIYTAVHQIC